MDGPHLDLPLEPSRRLLAVQAVLHAAALAAVVASGPGNALRVLVCVLVVASLGGQIAAFATGQRRGRQWLRCRAGTWILEGVAGSCEVRVLGDTTVWPWLVVLRIDLPRGRRTLVLLEDSLPPGGLRALRACLRTAGTRLRE